MKGKNSVEEEEDAPAGAPSAPPAPPPAWYYASPTPGNPPVGPYPEPDFAALARAGAMPLETPVWRSGLEWAPLAEHGPAHLGIPAATLRQAALAAKTEAERRAGGQAAGGAGEGEEAAALADPAAAAPSPPPGERRFVEDGTAFEWDSTLRRFVEAGDAEDEAPAAAKKAAGSSKRSAADVLQRRGGGGGGSKKPQPPPPLSTAAGATAAAAPPPPPPPRPPTAVYVSGLPLDTTEAEVAAVFAKCGLIRPSKTDPSGRTPAVKLYRDAETGALKGDGTVSFLRPPSVDLAITLLDGVPLRTEAAPGGQQQAQQPVMSVSVAKFEAREGGGGGGGGGGDATARPPPPKRARAGDGGGGGGGKGGGRRPAHPPTAAAALAAKALAWDGFDDEAPPAATTVVARWDGEREGGALLLASLLDGGKDAVAAFEASLATVAGTAVGGAVDGVRAFLGEPAGLVATIRFRTAESATAALARLPGKPLGGNGGPPADSVELWDGVTGFRARPPRKAKAEAAAAAVVEKQGAAAAGDDDDDDDEDDQARLERFGADLFGE